MTDLWGVFRQLSNRLFLFQILFLFLVALAINLSQLSISFAAGKVPSALAAASQNRVTSATDRIIVRFRNNIQTASQSLMHQRFGASVRFSSKSVPGLQLLEVAPGSNINDVLARYKNNPAVLYAEPDHKVYFSATYPDDASFGELWGLDNTGQLGGVPDADINTPEAWDITQGNQDVVVAVVDTGIDYTHVDLVDNMWVNPGEIANNGLDDDGNGHIDDIYGYDAGDGDSDPMDPHYHGTHVAGTIGARGNNALGVAGVNWNVKIIACKILAATSQTLEAFVSDAIECLDYLYDLKVNRGIDIIATNNSWGWVGDPSQALKDAIQRQADAGILFVAAAGNDSIDTNIYRDYPATYYLPNIISVAATDRFDNLATFSNYGSRTVHVGAPGVDVFSTMPGGSGTIPPAQNPHTDVYFDDVESGPGTWLPDPPWEVSTTTAFSGVAAWTDSPYGNYVNNADTSLMSQTLDLTPWAGQPLYLSFYANYMVEDYFDNVYIEVSGDSGLTWQVLSQITGTSSGWEFFSYTIPQSLATSTFKFRFRLISDSIISMDGIYLDDIGIGTTPYVPEVIGSNAYGALSGTSMAAPHTVGLVALLKSQDMTRTWSELKNLIISSGSPLPALSNSISGRRIRAFDTGGVGALSCTNQTVQSRLRPLSDNHTIEVGASINVSMLNINCGQPAGSVVVTLLETGDSYPLTDDGLGFDQVAGDGIYSAQINVSQFGLSQVTLQFPDGGTANVTVIQNYQPAVITTNNEWRDITGVEQLLPTASGIISAFDAPFPIHYADDQTGFDRINVSANGYIVLQRAADTSFVPSYFNNMPIPTTAFENIIAPFWDDLMASGSSMSWAVLGTAPNRELVVEWRNFTHYNFSPGSITFQIVFFEGAADILFNYQDVVFGSLAVDSGLSATVGLQASSTVGREFSYNAASLSDMMSLMWSTENLPPVLDPIGDQNVIEGDPLNMVVTASDPNATSPILSVQDLPPGAVFDANTGSFIWDNPGPPGDYTVTFTATDSLDTTLMVSEVITITVVQNHQPTISGVSDHIVKLGGSLAMTIVTGDLNGTPVQVSVNNLPPGAEFDSTTGNFIWSTISEPGLYFVTFNAHDSVSPDLDVTATATIHVTTTPQIAPLSDVNVIQGEDIFFVVEVVDSNSLPTILRASGVPSTASFNASTGAFVWHNVSEVGTHSVTFITENPADVTESNQQTVNVIVQENFSPVISPIADITLMVGDTLDVDVMISDANQTPPMVRVVNLPAGASYDSTTGKILWRDVTALSNHQVVIIATDIIDSTITAVETFSISIADNQPSDPVADPVDNTTDPVDNSTDPADSGGNPSNTPSTGGGGGGGGGGSINFLWLIILLVVLHRRY